MSDLFEQLWPAFLAESNEHVEALELGLVAEGDGRDVNAIFRSFHTLKGGCAMMGLSGMEAIAHACEDLLDPVRKGLRGFDRDMVEVLLAALDGLKQRLATARQDRHDAPADDALLARLRALLAPAAAAETVAGGRGVGATSQAAAPLPAGKAPPIDVTRLADAARVSLPLLCEAALLELPLQDTVPEMLAAFDTAARTAQAPAAAALQRALAAATTVDDRLGLLAELMDRLAFLEEHAAVDAGTRYAATTLRALREPALRALVKSVPLAFADVSGDAALALAEALVREARLLRLSYSLGVLRQCLQLLREIRRGTLEARGVLPGLLSTAAALPGELLDGLDEDAPYQSMCARLEEKLDQAAREQQDGEDLAARGAALRERLHISDDTFAALDAPALERLQAALARGERIYELEADMEAATDAGQALVDWLRANGSLVSNHSVFSADRGTVVLSFLVGLSLAPTAVRAALGGIRPAPRALRLHSCDGDVHYAASGAEGERAVASAEATGAAAPGTGAGNAGSAGHQTLRVDSSAVDAFVNRVGEMVMLRNMLSHTLQRDDLAMRQSRAALLLRERSEARPLANHELQELRDLLAALGERQEQLQHADLRLQGALSRLQEEALALRVVPVALVFNRLPRVVHDLSHSLGRHVRLDISGEEVRIDKGMVDVLAEPLLHLVRNAIDHGIEPPETRRAAGKAEEALLRVAARQHGNSLLIEVGDDGRGLAYERIRARAVANGLVSAEEAAQLDERELGQLIFLPGFSTAEQVTGVSGRGVGMDAVKTRVLHLGGQVEVASEAGRGTTFTLRLPLSAAIQNVILVESGTRQLGLPERNVTEILQLPVTALQTVQGQACCLLRGITLPLYHLAVLLGHGEAAPPSGATVEVVVLTDGVYRLGLVVERVVGRPEVFLRDIHPDLVRLPGVGGASILGDGRVVIIVDCESVFDLALRHAQSLRTLLRTP